MFFAFAAISGSSACLCWPARPPACLPACLLLDTYSMCDISGCFVVSIVAGAVVALVVRHHAWAFINCRKSDACKTRTWRSTNMHKQEINFHALVALLAFGGAHEPELARLTGSSVEDAAKFGLIGSHLSRHGSCVRRMFCSYGMSFCDFLCTHMYVGDTKRIPGNCFYLW